MKVVLREGPVREGRGIDLSETQFSPEAVASAIRRTDAVDGLRIECADPGPGHDHLGRVPSSTVTRGHLLEAVGRSRRLQTPVDAEIARIESRLAEQSSPADPDAPRDLRAARRRLAEAGDDESRLRERVATLRGRLNAHRETGDEEAITTTRDELVSVTTELSEVVTERVAAEQRLDALERRARSVRDSRDLRLQHTDALANRRRDARAYFIEKLGDEFDVAVRELSEATFETADADELVRQLAAVRLADFSAPVVLTCRAFTDVETAAHYLDSPVVRV
jgi:hypothetical protein